jgi:hypothetical protein
MCLFIYYTHKFTCLFICLFNSGGKAREESAGGISSLPLLRRNHVDDYDPHQQRLNGRTGGGGGGVERGRLFYEQYSMGVGGQRTEGGLCVRGRGREACKAAAWRARGSAEVSGEGLKGWERKRRGRKWWGEVPVGGRGEVGVLLQNTAYEPKKKKLLADYLLNKKTLGRFPLQNIVISS